MRPRRICCWTAWLMLAAWASLPASANIITVSQGGPVATLNAALGMANPGDTINVQAGPSDYVEGTQLIALNNLTIQGTNGTPRWTGTRLLLTAPGVTLRNLEIDGQRQADLKNLVRVSTTASGALIEGCRIVNPASGTGTGFVGNRTQQSQDAVITDPGTCVTLSDVSDVTIRNCNFECDMNTAVYNQGTGTFNEVNIFSEGYTARQNILIEGCAFQAHVRNLTFFGRHANVTIRNNDFNRTQLGAYYVDTPTLNGFSTGNILFLPPVSELLTVTCDGLLIQGNRFNQSAGTSIFFFNGIVNGVQILDNTWGQKIWSPNVGFKNQGDTCVLAGNVFQATRTDLNGANAGSLVFEQDPPLLTAAGESFQSVIFKDNHFVEANMDYLYSRASTTQMVVEDNVFEPCLGAVYFQTSNLSNVRFVRNICNGSSQNSDQDAAVELASANNVVADNVFRNGDAGVEFHRFTGVVEAERPGGQNVVAGNVITGMALFGIQEQTQTISTTIYGRHGRSPYTLIGTSANQYYNNTIAVNQAAVGMDIHTSAVNVYNNIVFLNDAGINIAGASPGVLDFNLVASNGSGGARNFQGLATPGPHSLVNVNPGFVDFLMQDFNLMPSSPARNAGTAPGGPISEPDFVTEIGAMQDLNVDTHVPAAQWQLYR